ncbi:MAG TPA: hypothetical protein V6D06_09175, partial [Trichocoleus sp.]
MPALLAALALSGSNAHAADFQLAQTPAPSATESDSISPEQRPISETKRRLIDQVLELTGGQRMYEQTQQALFA